MDQKITTTERTSKEFKALTLAAWGALIIGLILMGAGNTGPKAAWDDQVVYFMGAFLAVSSVPLWIWSKFGAYWHNG